MALIFAVLAIGSTWITAVVTLCGLVGIVLRKLARPRSQPDAPVYFATLIAPLFAPVLFYVPLFAMAYRFQECIGHFPAPNDNPKLLRFTDPISRHWDHVTGYWMGASGALIVLSVVAFLYLLPRTRGAKMAWLVAVLSVVITLMLFVDIRHLIDWWLW